MKSMLGMCLNWKVLAGLGAVAVALFVVAPGYALAALPLLILAICPLSMIGMMFAMKGGMGAMRGHKDDAGPESPDAVRARIAAIRQEQSELELRLSQPPAPTDASVSPVRTAAAPETSR